MNEFGIIILVGLFIIFIAFSILADEFFTYQDNKRKNGAAFSVGSKVHAFGNFGVVKNISNGFVIVKFDDFESTVVFNEDGKLMKWHKEASLKHV